ncbi:MAG: peptidase MA family metallohydrolase [Syntrophales bacterium]|nr:peptidase MA family metallohydrolase [Syntrophales bacterium]
MVCRKKVLLFICLILLFPTPLRGTQRSATETDAVIVLFEEPLEIAAKEVSDIYPALREELEKTLGWRLDFKPTVLLIKDRQTFQERAGSTLFTAFAVPGQRLIVIDYSRMAADPSLLATTLKHELCHLLLHHHIQSANLPRWLDEGISQWVSGGMAGIIMDRERFVLNRAVLSGNYISIRNLVTYFPAGEVPLLTAYEESKDLIEYINRKFGRKGILDILKYLREGYAPDRAIHRSLSISLAELESKWVKDLGKRATWFTYLVVHLYQTLFFLGALLTVFGFIRARIRKRNYQDDDIFSDE